MVSEFEVGEEELSTKPKSDGYREQFKYYCNKLSRTPDISSQVDQVNVAHILDKSNGLNRVLGTFDLTMIGISSTIGAGIYVLTGTVASDVAGPGVVLSYIIAGIASFFSAVCYCELSSIYPRGGSAYSYIYLSMGEALGFIIGWNIILEYMVGSAAIVRSFTTYMGQFFFQILGVIENNSHNKLRTTKHHFDYWSLSICLIVTVLIIVYGIKKYSLLNTVGTIINLTSIAVITLAGLFYINVDNWSNFAPYGIQGIISGASICFFSYVGFDVVASLGDEAVNAKKTIPISIFLTIAISATLYIVVSAILTLMAPYNSLKGSAAFVEAFLRNNNKFATWFVSIGASVGLMTCIFSSLLPTPRIIYTMARDGLLFSPLAWISKSTNIPIISTIVGGLMSGTLAFFLSVEELVEMMSIGTLLAYTGVCVGVIVMRVKMSECENPECEMVYKDMVYILLSFLFISSFVISFIVVYGGEHINFDVANFSLQRHFIAILLAILVIVDIFIVLFLYKIMNFYKLNNEYLTFVVPFVPVVPLLGMFINVFLMASLHKITWLRFIIWMAIGEIIYFLYSIKHSVLEN